MSFKRILNVFFICLSLIVLWAVLYAARSFARKIAIEHAASEISKKYFRGMTYTVDHKKRVVTFAQNDIELLKKYKLGGKFSFHFPVRFFELPWRTDLQRITVDGVNWELDLKNHTINGVKRDDFLKMAQQDMVKIFPGKSAKYIAFVTDGTLKLINPEGRTRSLAMKSILNKTKDFYLLGIHAGDMKVNFLYRDHDKKIVGQYLAKESDFEFFRLSFGIPELFNMTNVDKLTGQFCYDTGARKLEYIRGSSEFGVQSSIRGAIFTLYGSRMGRINWEYLNQQNWNIELRNASSVTPVKAGLHYFVISQNTLERDALNFDGELEFYPQSFKDMFGLELDRRSAGIRHRIVGKWDMSKKTWELSRLDTQKRVPQVKLKWNDLNVAFQGQSFKLSGSGAQADHFGFHYELEMGNVDLKDGKGNIIIGSQMKLEGDCILSLADDKLQPLSSGRISCSVADGAVEKSRFLLKNINLSFAPDTDGRNKYAFSVGEFKLGLPDFKKGANIDIGKLDGRISSTETVIESPVVKFNYGALHLQNSGRMKIKKASGEKNITLTIPAVNGSLGRDKISAGKISGKLELNKNSWSWQGDVNALKVGKDIFKAQSAAVAASGKIDGDFYPVFRDVTLSPRVWRFKNDHMSCSSPSSEIKFIFDEKNNWTRRILNFGQMTVNFRGSEHIMPEFTAEESNHGKYAEGTLKCDGTPYKVEIAYSRKNKSGNIELKSGRISGNDSNIWGLSGNIKLKKDDTFMDAAIRYAEMKYGDRMLENGNIKFIASRKNGIELKGFDGTFAAEMSKISYVGRNNRGENVFDVQKFPAKYVENVLGVPEGMLNGMFDGTITVSADEFYNPFKIQTFYLKNNFVTRVRMGALQSSAIRGNSVDDDFATDALKDFFAKSLVLEYQKVGSRNILTLKALGKSTELLPYEFDVKEKKLKKSKVSLFNSEVEVIMKYIIKKT